MEQLPTLEMAALKSLKLWQISALVGPFAKEIGDTVLAACVVLFDGSELRGEEVTRGEVPHELCYCRVF